MFSSYAIALLVRQKSMNNIPKLLKPSVDRQAKWSAVREGSRQCISRTVCKVFTSFIPAVPRHLLFHSTSPTHSRGISLHKMNLFRKVPESPESSFRELETNVKNSDDTAFCIVFVFSFLTKLGSEWTFFGNLVWRDTQEEGLEFRAYAVRFVKTRSVFIQLHRSKKEGYT